MFPDDAALGLNSGKGNQRGGVKKHVGMKSKVKRGSTEGREESLRVRMKREELASTVCKRV